MFSANYSVLFAELSKSLRFAGFSGGGGTLLDMNRLNTKRGKVNRLCLL
jgi:hypothetical protein